MTRRVIVYEAKNTLVNEGIYFISQEFNGDRKEAVMFNPQTSIRANWSEVVELFNGIDSLHGFRIAVRKAEDLYTYENISLAKEKELPKHKEIWMLSNGKLQLVSALQE